MSFEALFFPVLIRRKRYSNYKKHSDYRQEIREDCQGRCVYCDAHENELGGAEYMTLDHLRPKSYRQYTGLAHNPTNLLWSCHTCNNKKENHWPAIGTSHTFIGAKGFLDPFLHNRRDYFSVKDTGELSATKDPATYMIQLLVLNRSASMMIRAKRIKNYQTYERMRKYYDTEKQKIESKLKRDTLTDSERETLLEAKINLDNMVPLLDAM